MTKIVINYTITILIALLITILILFQVNSNQQRVTYKIQQLNSHSVESLKIEADCNVFVVGDTIKIYRGSLVTAEDIYVSVLADSYVVKSITIHK